MSEAAHGRGKLDGFRENLGSQASQTCGIIRAFWEASREDKVNYWEIAIVARFSLIILVCEYELSEHKEQ